MKQVDVFLGGEGANDLGGRSGHPSYQTDESPGVIETLLRQVRQSGWTVSGAVQWSKIRKFQARGPSLPEERNVLGLIEAADAAKAEVVAFVRDADDDKDRPGVIDAAITKARETFPDIDVIGGSAVPVLEAWILAMLGRHGTEKLGKARAQSKLKEAGIEPKCTVAMVAVVSKVVREELPPDASRLTKWLETAAEVLERRVPEA